MNSVEIRNVAIGKVKPYERNPRYIKDNEFENLKKSLVEFPEMLKMREIIVDENMVILGGTMRYLALKDLGEKKIDVKIVKGLTDEKKNEFRIKDNANYGEWDYDILSADYDVEVLSDWGVDLPVLGGEDSNEYGTDFSLPSGDKSPFQQMTFTLADEQATLIQNKLAEIKDSNEYALVETYGNENSNGNALYLLVRQWVERKK